MTKARTVAPGIQKLGEQHYRVWWSERGTGQRRSRIVRGTLEEAKELRAAMLDSQTRGVYIKPGSITLRQYVDRWLERHETMGETRTTTHERYTSLLMAVCSRLGDIPLQELEKGQIEDYYTWCLKNERTRRGTLVKRDTVNKRHKLLKKVLEDAAEDKIVPRNPATKAAHPPAERRHGEAFTREEAQIVLAAVHESWVDLPVRIALYTGMRLGEVAALRWRHVEIPDKEQARLTVAGIVTESKVGFEIQPYAKSTHSRRTIAIGPELAATLKMHRRVQAERRLALGIAWEDNDLVVCGEYGQLLRPSKLSARFTPIVRLLEDEGALATSGATFHTTRHTHATLALKGGEPVHVVSRRLGHSKIQITLDYYAHAMPDDDEALAQGFEETLGKPYENRTMHMKCTSKAASELEAASL
jgi:integrase